MIERFKLSREDFEAIEIARDLARRLLRHRSITARQIIGLGFAILALDRLPRSTPGAQVEFGIIYRCGDEDFSEMRYIDFCISEEAFEIRKGGSVYERAVGSDRLSEPGWLVEIGGYRCTECELYRLQNDVNEFLNLGAEPSVTCESSINFEELEEEADGED